MSGVRLWREDGDCRFYDWGLPGYEPTHVALPAAHHAAREAVVEAAREWRRLVRCWNKGDEEARCNVSDALREASDDLAAAIDALPPTTRGEKE